ncbi:hypothetical protein TWF506_009743 [Arthrobotrys conoides]|uniref:Uncharacterized protein n=1 Tax=Arthrobotrys conoides TaxID=74498 RepID=A0AAN8RSU1_9PEZI
MLRKDQRALVVKLDGLKSDGDAYLRQLDDVIQSFNSAQKGHNVLLSQLAELVKLQKAETAPVAAANVTLEEAQRGSSLMVEGPSQGMVMPSPLKSPIMTPATKRHTTVRQGIGPAKAALSTLSHLSGQMRWIEIDLVKLWDQQIRESVMARRTLSVEYERFMAAIRQYADKHFGGGAASPRSRSRATILWVVNNFDVSYYADYPLGDVKLELRTHLQD